MFSRTRPQLPRIIICDDHRLVAEGLARLLMSEYRVAAIVTSSDELLSHLRSRSAECLILDLEMPGRNGMGTIPLVRQLRPELKILVVTMLVDRTIADSVIAAGAAGFVPKDAPAADLLTAIGDVLAGRLYISPSIPKATHRVGLTAAHRGLHRLTARQQQIALMIGDGKCASEIADALAVSPSTITFHRHNIMRTLGIELEAELVKFAVTVRMASASAGNHTSMQTGSRRRRTPQSTRSK